MYVAVDGFSVGLSEVLFAATVLLAPLPKSHSYRVMVMLVPVGGSRKPPYKDYIVAYLNNWSGWVLGNVEGYGGERNQWGKGFADLRCDLDCLESVEC